MSLVNSIKEDIKDIRKMRLPWWGLLIGIFGSALGAWLFDHFGQLSLALPTVNCMAVLGFAIAVKRRVWRCVWFWGAITLLVALHVPLILFVPWTTKWFPAIAIAAIDSGDLILMLGILAAVERFVGVRKTDGV